MSFHPFGRGPFRTDQIRDGDPYELHEGHPIFCPPPFPEVTAVRRHAAIVLDTDPATTEVGLDTGIAVTDTTLRAADIAVNFTHGPGTWATGAPLVLLCATAKTDDADFRAKIEAFLTAGTRWVWVVYLTGLRRVEVHTRTERTRVVVVGEQLEAPGILQNPVPVEALFDRELAHALALRNLLQRRGYDSLEAYLADQRPG